MDPDYHWPFLRADKVPGENVQPETVLVAHPGVPLGGEVLRTDVTVVLGLSHPLPRLSGDWRGPTTFVSGRLEMPHPPECQDPLATSRLAQGSPEQAGLEF